MAFPVYSDPSQYESYFNAHLNHGKPLPIPLPGSPGQVIPGSTIGQQWLAWYEADSTLHPGNSVAQYAAGFLITWESVELGSDLSAAVGEAGTVTAAIGTGAVAGTSQFTQQATTAGGLLTGVNAIGDFFTRLTSKQLWIRVAEVGLGLLLFAVGLNHALGNPAGKAARTAAKGAAFL
jgi:hypothetical protein